MTACLRKIARADVLILDDWGPEQLTAPQRRDLMEIIDERYGRKATVVTSQLPIDTWHDMIGDPTFADAILDRLVHNAHKFALDGPSMRKTSSRTKQTSEAGTAP
jgi:DNA replication protein DnaC